MSAESRCTAVDSECGANRRLCGGGRRMNMGKNKINFNNPRIKNALLIMLVGIAGNWAYFHYGIGALVNERNELRNTLTKNRSELAEILSMKRELGVLRRETALFERRLDSLREKFPDDEELPGLIREITRVARSSRVIPTKFNPLPDNEREFYTENNYAMALTGGYHELAVFFSQLANLPLITNVSDMKITATGGLEAKLRRYKHHGGPLQTIDATFRMTTFSSKR
ncbi:MAG: type 4a pilus biogenesis protein PilO [Chitinivibrionales bacterium]|nr:type 4a pilus biogenesis protein PilO [Chitinivibrionales bacterium]MBD3356895.1 type 4a pilus biogenesis protein PilO [Chitinivibrionales bacterium]